MIYLIRRRHSVYHIASEKTKKPIDNLHDASGRHLLLHKLYAFIVRVLPTHRAKCDPCKDTSGIMQYLSVIATSWESAVGEEVELVCQC